MKIFRYVCLGMAVLLAAGCVVLRPGLEYKRVSAVERGMSVREVVSLLGKPAYRSFNEREETLEFRTDAYGTAKVVKLQFVDGRVVAMDSYLDYRRPGCLHTTREEEREKTKEGSSAAPKTTIRVTEEGKHVVEIR